MSRIILVLTLGSVLLLGFQNCGQISIESMPQLPAPVPQKIIDGQFCSEIGPNYTTPLKILFIVDMSMSNLGGTLNYTVGPGANPYRWTIGKWYKDAVQTGQSLPSFDMQAVASGTTPQQLANQIVVSDGDGRRFQAIERFISPDSICSQINTNFSYSVFGFSASQMMPKFSSQSCDSRFTSNTQDFQSMISGLRRYQDEDGSASNKVRSAGSESPYQMAETNYIKGLQCMQRKVELDALYENNNLPFYYVVFMSDGMPSDQYDPCPWSELPPQCQFGSTFNACRENAWNQCLAKWNINRNCYDGTTARAPNYSCISSVVIPRSVELLKQEIEPFTSGFKFQPVFYWPEGQTGDQYENARQIMEPMAQMGGVSSVIRLQDDAAMLNLENQICSTIETSMRVNYEIRNYYAVNLTARMVRGQLKADSDMDGIPDDEESAGNATNARSNGRILDGLCQMSPNTCAQITSCDANQFHALGLNQCDLQMLRQMTPRSVNAVDSNQNGVLDFIELIKGGNPISLDPTYENGDGDSMSLAYEIANGYDITSNDDTYPPHPTQLMNAHFYYSQNPSQCGGERESMNFALENLPKVKTKAFVDPRQGPLNLSHAEDENVIAVYYSITPVGSLAGVTDKHFVHLFRVKYDQSPELSITPSSFVELEAAP